MKPEIKPIISETRLYWSYNRELESEDCLDLNFAAPPCEKVTFVPDTNNITSAIRKFRLDMQSPGSFQNIGLLI